MGDQIPHSLALAQLGAMDICQAGLLDAIHPDFD
eukprot:XP_001709004.1 Hypothetical protein GL50803_26678 [Giardia lamblia ATCC 50803]